VKNILIFLLLFLCISCGSTQLITKPKEIIDCPIVYYSSEDRTFLESEEQIITLDNLSFKAEINNYAFSKPCFKQNNLANFPLDILIVAEPINLKSPNITLPIYVALFDVNEKLVDVQYFTLLGSIQVSNDDNKFIETELTKLLSIVQLDQNIIFSLVIGFMLDEKRKEILN
tara:strand:+ start:93 stop:608 length:516 start_codon:yes stop_codon:yes gene_type:complete